ncbi:ankyrin repeat-containing domain protein [Helicostylum pulchrum]|nr:ankyrin repeat-containing domain protein [Helicostylum pulchrum]
MMYAPQAKPTITDSCFVDIDLTDELKRNNEVSKRPTQVNVAMDTEPPMSIWKAAELGNMAALSYFIHRHYSDTDGDGEPTIVNLLNSRDPNTECTLLHLIISNNPNPLLPLELLLKYGADATSRNIYNIQAIHALFIGCKTPLEPLKLLIKYEADVNARDGDGWTPAHYAARFCPYPDPILKYLVGVGADINAIDASKKTALFALLANGDHSMTLDWLINTAKASIKVQGDFLNNQTRRTRQGTLVLQAAKYGRLSCLRILISSASAMESLEGILTRDELKDSIELVRHQLIKVTKRDNIERLGLMIMILENLLEKLFGKESTTIKRRPSLLNRMGWK